MQSRYYRTLLTYRKGILECHKHWDTLRSKERNAHTQAHQKAAEEACRAAEQRKEDEDILYMAILGNGEVFPVTLGYVRQHGLV